MMKRKHGKKRGYLLLLGCGMMVLTMSFGVRAGAKTTKAVFLKKAKIQLDWDTKKSGKVTVKKRSGIKIQKISYKSKDPEIAVVSKKAKITAKGSGTTKILIRVTFQKNGKTYSRRLTCKVTVTKKNEAAEGEKEPEVEDYMGEIRVVRAQVPEKEEESSDGLVAPGGEHQKWLANIQKWKDKEKTIDMKKFYQQTLSFFLGKEENTVYSPINVYLALSMLAEAGDGKTQEEILNLLQVNDVDMLREHVDALWHANYYDTSFAESILGNSIWLNQRVNYNEELLKTLSKKYHASSYSGVMGSKLMDQALHEWMNENTKDLLKDSVDSITLPPDTVLEMISTIYFKAAWKDKFSKSSTKEEIFHGKNGEEKVSMMHRSANGSVYRSNRFTGLSLGLSSGMIHFLLPKEGASLSEVVRDDAVMEMICVEDTEEARQNRNSHMEHAKISMSIPKFELHSKIDLTDGLRALGVQKAFDAVDADFSPLFAEGSGERAFVSKTEHAAMVKLDEEGVIGAAYTDIGIAASALIEKKIDFVLDRPFYYVITAEDGSILFAGTVYDL